MEAVFCRFQLVAHRRWKAEDKELHRALVSSACAALCAPVILPVDGIIGVPIWNAARLS